MNLSEKIRVRLDYANALKVREALDALCFYGAEDDPRLAEAERLMVEWMKDYRQRGRGPQGERDQVTDGYVGEATR